MAYLLSNPTLRVVAREFADALGAEVVDPAILAKTNQVVVRVTDDWVPVQVTPEWTAAFRLVVQDGQPVIGEVRIFPSENVGSVPPDDGSWSASAVGRRAEAPAGGMRARLLNKVKWGPVTDFIRQAAMLVPMINSKFNVWNGSSKELFPQASKEGKRRRGKPDSFYAEIAEEYVGLLGQRNRSPIVSLAESRGTSAAKMRDMIHEARSRDLLTRKSQGVAGGQLTPKAIEILKPEKK